MQILQITQASSDTELQAIRQLFRDYNTELGIDLTFQDFETELASLPGRYAPPTGRLLLATDNQKPVGCVALYAMKESGVAEIKRLYVAPEAKGQGIGRQLMECVIEAAREIGYNYVRLDSLQRLSAARKLYATYGFYEIDPYNVNPQPDVYYMEKKLTN